MKIFALLLLVGCSHAKGSVVLRSRCELMEDTPSGIGGVNVYRCEFENATCFITAATQAISCFPSNNP